jgi:hypothetical protein
MEPKSFLNAAMVEAYSIFSRMGESSVDHVISRWWRAGLLISKLKKKETA